MDIHILCYVTFEYYYICYVINLGQILDSARFLQLLNWECEVSEMKISYALGYAYTWMKYHLCVLVNSLCSLHGALAAA